MCITPLLHHPLKKTTHFYIKIIVSNVSFQTDFEVSVNDAHVMEVSDSV